MELSNISTVVRPRSSWQAIDLGFRMGREWFMPMVTAYLLLTLPVFLFLQFVLQGELNVWAATIFWWLKPLWERILLAFLSVRQFGETPSVKSQFQMWRKVALRQIIPTLLWRRLSPQRSYNMAIMQLENLSGERRAKRLMQFGGDNQQAAFWLTVVGAHIEVLITFALFILAYLLFPPEYNIGMNLLEIMSASEFALSLAGYAAMVLVAPFYIAAGFSLYLNQRTQIEGWDIEITFKRLVERQQARSKRPVGTLMLCIALIGGSMLMPKPVMAAQQQTTSEQQKVREMAKEILLQPPFTRMETKSYPEFYLEHKPAESEDTDSKSMELGWLGSLLGFLAGSIEWLIAALIIGLIIIIAVRYRHAILELIPSQFANNAKETTKVVMGLDIDEASMPDDLVGTAQTLWSQGEKRQALSLLYRGALSELVSRRQLEVHDSFTEGECLSQVRGRTSNEIYHYFEDITRHWQRLAYAAVIPDEQAMTQLFKQWPQVFARTDDESKR